MRYRNGFYRNYNGTIRGNLDVECFKLQRTWGSWGWLRTTMDSCVSITGEVFSEVSLFPKRDTNLWKHWESLSRYIMLFLKPSILNLCALWYNGLVSCRWSVGQCFWSCFLEVGVVAGGASWTDSGPCTQHGRVGLCPELLPCMSEGFSIGFFIFSFSLWSAL